MEEHWCLTDLIDHVKPDVRPATKKSYYYGLKRAAPAGIQKRLGMGLSANSVSIKWIASHGAVLRRLRENVKGVQKTTLTPLMVVTRALLGEDSASYAAYAQAADQLNVHIEAGLQEHTKSKTQEENWITMEELQAHVKEMPIKTELEKVRRLIGALYVFQPPVRNDYGEMQLLDEGSERLPERNYLIMREGQPTEFFFQNFKTVKTAGFVTVPLTLGMQEEVLSFLDGRTTGMLFSSGLTKTRVAYLLAQAFEGLGKHITINLIRHIVASELVDYQEREKEQALAASMMHSNTMQVKYAKA